MNSLTPHLRLFLRTASLSSSSSSYTKNYYTQHSLNLWWTRDHYRFGLVVKGISTRATPFPSNPEQPNPRAPGEDGLIRTHRSVRRQIYRSAPYEDPPKPPPAAATQQEIDDYYSGYLDRPVYPKRRNPLRRAKAIRAFLDALEAERMVKEGLATVPKEIPNFKVGDIICVKTVDTLKKGVAKKYNYFTGLCIARRNKGLGSTFVLRNVVDGVPVERGFPVYSPLIVQAKILESFKVKKNKLYYLRNLPDSFSSYKITTDRPQGWETVYFDEQGMKIDIPVKEANLNLKKTKQLIRAEKKRQQKIDKA